MKNINELVAASESNGSITLVNDCSVMFTPHFKTKSGEWYGKDTDGNADFFVGHLRRWKIYKEPVKTVTKWLWMRPSDNAVTSYLCSESEQPPVLYTQKLEWSKTEVEEIV
jgi:hypothetical protein